MDSILIPWNDGNGNIVVSKVGGEILISSDVINESVERTQVLTFQTINGADSATLTVIQKGNKVVLQDSNLLILKDINGKILTSNK